MSIRKLVLSAILMASLFTLAIPASFACGDKGNCKCISAEKACAKCGKESCKCGCEGDPAKCTCTKKNKRASKNTSND